MNSEPSVRVVRGEFRIAMDSVSCTAFRILEVNNVPFSSSQGTFQPRSAELLQARSALRFPRGFTWESPVASVSSVNGVGANTPVPVDRRAVNARGSRTSAETRGLKNAPYLL